MRLLQQELHVLCTDGMNGEKRKVLSEGGLIAEDSYLHYRRVLLKKQTVEFK